MKKTWPVQDAKTRFSKLLKASLPLEKSKPALRPSAGGLLRIPREIEAWLDDCKLVRCFADESVRQTSGSIVSLPGLHQEGVRQLRIRAKEQLPLQRP